MSVNYHIEVMVFHENPVAFGPFEFERTSATNISQLWASGLFCCIRFHDCNSPALAGFFLRRGGTEEQDRENQDRDCREGGQAKPEHCWISFLVWMGQAHRQRSESLTRVRVVPG